VAISLSAEAVCGQRITLFDNWGNIKLDEAGRGGAGMKKRLAGRGRNSGERRVTHEGGIALRAEPACGHYYQRMDLMAVVLEPEPEK